MKAVSALAVALTAVAASADPSPVQVDANATPVRRAASLPTVTQKGNAFWQGSTRFYLKGIDYQPGGSSQLTDPLADPSTCKRDIKYFQELGLNTIRVYSVDNSANHDECMQALDEAGIYLVLDVNTPKYSLNQIEPAKSYNPYYLQSVFATIDMFSQYDNTLCFMSGNEVVNAANNTNAAPYVKAVTRDMKQYIGERGYRAIPVGYGAADVVPEQYTMAQYMACGETAAQADFYAINNYEWCDPSSFTTSGWDVLVDQYKNFSIPIYLSEYGCITNTRKFQETPALYEPDMTVAISGGLVYEYAESGNGYGVVQISGNSVTPVGQQFDYLKAAMAKVKFPSGSGGASMNNGPQPCPQQQRGYWETSPFTGEALPATPQGAQQLFKNGAGKGPGFSGDGSQEAPGGSSATASSNAGAVTATYGNGQPGSTGGSGSSAATTSAPLNLGPVMVCGAAIAISFVLGLQAL